MIRPARIIAPAVFVFFPLLWIGVYRSQNTTSRVWLQRYTLDAGAAFVTLQSEQRGVFPIWGYKKWTGRIIWNEDNVSTATTKRNQQLVDRARADLLVLSGLSSVPDQHVDIGGVWIFSETKLNLWMICTVIWGVAGVMFGWLIVVRVCSSIAKNRQRRWEQSVAASVCPQCGYSLDTGKNCSECGFGKGTQASNMR